MVFFLLTKLAPDPLPRLLTNVNKKMVFFIEGFPYTNITPHLATLGHTLSVECSGHCYNFR